jgi:hypothetical protein
MRTLLLAIAILGCQRSQASAPPPPAEHARAAEAAHAPHMYPAVRCGQCHTQIYRAWSTSAHANADRGAGFVAMRGERRDCDVCHAPLAAEGLPGIPCDGCHLARAATTPGAGLALAIADVVRYGPLCDAKDTYFHKMGCAPEVATSIYCAACHELRIGALPIYTEYEEWRQSPYAADGATCQGCHMPPDRTQVATGAEQRDVAAHGFLGVGNALRQQAIELAASVDDAGVVTTRVHNSGAGHAVPTGLPGRQLVVRVIAFDAQGRELARREQIYSRVLVDDLGREVPYPQARKLAKDDRIGVNATAVATFAFTGEPSAFRIDVVERLSPALVPGSAEVTLTERQLRGRAAR